MTEIQSKFIDIIKDAKKQFSSTRFCGVMLATVGAFGFLMDGFNFFSTDVTMVGTVLGSAALMLGVKDVSKMSKGGGNA